MDKDYKYTINSEIDLSKQDISDEANAILVSLFKNYFADDKQKEILNNLLKQNQVKIDKIKNEKYNRNNLFISKQTKNFENNEMSLIEHKKDTIFQRIKKNIKQFFTKKRGKRK